MAFHLFLRGSPRALVLVSEQSNTADGKASASANSKESPDEANDAVAIVLSAALPPPPPAAARLSDAQSTPVQAEIVPAASIAAELSTWRRLTNGPSFGCLGLLAVGSDVFLAIATHATAVGSLRPDEPVMRLQQAQMYALASSQWDGSNTVPLSRSNEAGQPREHPCADVRRLLSDGSFYFTPGNRFDISRSIARRTTDDARTLYDDEYIWNRSMLAPLQEGVRLKLPRDLLARFDRAAFLLPLIRGSVSLTRMPSTQLGGSAMHLALVSRAGCNRTSNELRDRGLDDDGHVSSFVETETIFYLAGTTFSYVQVQGSVPVFWEEQISLASLGQARVVLTRPWTVSEPVFIRHWARLTLRYGQVLGLSLLDRRGPERDLADEYAHHIGAATGAALRASAEAVVRSLPTDGELQRTFTALSSAGLLDLDPRLIEWDVDAILARLDEDPELVRSELQRNVTLSRARDEFGFTVVDATGSVRLYQQGVVRTNCLDCIQRTNYVQGYLSQFALFAFLVRAASGAREDSGPTPNNAFVPYASPSHPLFKLLSRLWSQNGEALRGILADPSSSPSSGPSPTSSTSSVSSGRNKSWGGLLGSVVKSISRTYQSTFQQGARQSPRARGQDLLLDLTPVQRRQLRREQREQYGVTTTPPVRLVQALPELGIEDKIWSGMHAAQESFSTSVPLRVLVGTFNVGASIPSMASGWDDALAEWLRPRDGMPPPELLVIGFQELVPLNAPQVLMADETQRQQWERVLLLSLERIYETGEQGYQLVRSEQLVGTAIVVIAHASLLPHVKQVETCTKKTGFRGMSGNKGGVAVRLTVYGTSLCFVAAHLAAGQSQVAERATDAISIQQALYFGHGWIPDQHDHLVWLGDLNYRINLPGEQVRALVEQHKLDVLRKNDQLLAQRATVFPHLIEAPLTFRPTYKYDPGEDTYDSSDKRRVPAWCDRILSSRSEGWEQVLYTCANSIRISDHRPVCALFSTQLVRIDQAKRLQAYLDLLHKWAPDQRENFLEAYGFTSPKPAVLPSESWWPTDPNTDTDKSDRLDLYLANLDLPRSTSPPAELAEEEDPPPVPSLRPTAAPTSIPPPLPRRGPTLP